MSRERTIEDLKLDGDHPALDFVNTISHQQEEFIPDYQAFILWCTKTAIVPRHRLSELADHARTHAAQAEKAMLRIKEIRTLLYRLFSAVAAGQMQNVSRPLLAAFNQAYGEALAHLRIELHGTHLEQRWQQERINLLEPLWPVVQTAADLLLHGDYQRIKQCRAADCDWLFLDLTKNRKKQWCSPSTCGSIEKSKRYYQKRKRDEGRQ